MDRQKELNRLFEQAKNENVHRSFEETKQQFLHSIKNQSEQSWIKKVFTIKKLFIMTTILLSILLGVNFLSNSTEKNSTNKKISSSNETTISNETAVYKKKKNSFLSEESNLELESNEKGLTLEKTIRKKYPNDIHFSKLEMLSANLNMAIHPNDLLIKKGSSSSSIPVLSKDQIKENEKQKTKMLKALAKLKSDDYVFIPAGNMLYEDKTVAFQAFYMQTTEVSNLEYRTFLNDLIIQKRFEDYEIAKVDSTQWVEKYGKGMETMKNMYFSHPAFNNYPICNISRAGAELYCAWLQEEFKKEYEFKNQERYENLIRIPSRAEWCYAASNGKDNQVYPWGTDSITNSKGESLANKQSIPILDSIKSKPTNSTDNPNILSGVFLNNIVKGIPQTIYKFRQTSNGIYNLSGNIAEMVYEDYNSKERSGTAGGSWESNAEEIKIFGPDPYAGITTPHPAIGFRICFIYRKGL